MARRFKKKGRSAKAKPSVMSMVPLAYLGITAYDGYKQGGAVAAVDAVACTVAPINITARKIDFQRFAPFMGVCVGTYAAKKIVSYAGVNRGLKGLPFRL